MRYLPLILLLILLGSCCRFIPQKCITHSTDTLTVVRVDTFTITKDSTITVRIEVPGETVHDSIPYPVQVLGSGLVKSDTLFMEVPFARAWAVVENSILKGELVQKDSLIVVQKLLENVIRETTILRDSIVVVNNETTIIKKQYTKTKWVLTAVIIILGLILAIKIFKK